MTTPGQQGAGAHDVSRALQDAVSQSRKQFIIAVSALRPPLHRFCARMCGSSLDGEDVLQETLADAFYNLASLKETHRLEPWIFRIAYYKCVDFLRRERRRDGEVSFQDEHDRADEGISDDLDTPIDAALMTLVGELPPKERAAVLLKDVLDYPLAEVAQIADSTLGGVKAALHRGRAKLRSLEAAPTLSTFDADQRRLFEAYVECFNRRDWEALRQLVRADARLEIVGEKAGAMAGLGSTYSSNYTALPWAWRLGVGVVDGALVVVHWKQTDDGWQAHSFVRLWWDGGQVVRIRDYIHLGYLLRDAQVDSFDETAS